jgi:hypothetical protein
MKIALIPLTVIDEKLSLTLAVPLSVICLAPVFDDEIEKDNID